MSGNYYWGNTSGVIDMLQQMWYNNLYKNQQQKPYKYSQLANYNYYSKLDNLVRPPQFVVPSKGKVDNHMQLHGKNGKLRMQQGKTVHGMTVQSLEKYLACSRAFQISGNYYWGNTSGVIDMLQQM